LRKGKVASRHIRKIVREALGTKSTRPVSVLNDAGDIEPPVRYGFRTFDRQWLPADARLINDVRPVLWNAYSDRQVFLTAPSDVSPTAGPALSFTGLIPDLHHYHGRGGRVCPLWRDNGAMEPNVKPALLVHLAKVFA